jgi:rSAM/selenodomain-associated transferase 1
MSNALIIFIRNPELGKVKTRLARTLGDEEALRIYHILLEKTRLAALDVRASRWLFYSDFVDEQDHWPNPDFIKTTQAAGDLGERMEAAFRQVFEGGATKALIIGSDCPELSGTILQQAFDALELHDFVIGPVPDGGYYLLGMKQLQSDLFYDIAWSTETVRASTITKIEEARSTYALQPMLLDIDEAPDWQAFIGSALISQ